MMMQTFVCKDGQFELDPSAVSANHVDEELHDVLVSSTNISGERQRSSSPTGATERTM